MLIRIILWLFLIAFFFGTLYLSYYGIVNFSNLYSEALTFSGIVLGFLLTTFSAIYTKENFIGHLNDKKVLIRGILTTQLLQLRKCFSRAINISLFSCGGAIIGCFYTHPFLDALMLSLLSTQLFFSYMLFKVLLNGLIVTTCADVKKPN